MKSLDSLTNSSAVVIWHSVMLACHHISSDTVADLQANVPDQAQRALVRKQQHVNRAAVGDHQFRGLVAYMDSG